MKYLFGFLSAAFVSLALVQPALAMETLFYTEHEEQRTLEKVLIVTNPESIDELIASLLNYEQVNEQSNHAPGVEPGINRHNAPNHPSEESPATEASVDREPSDTGGASLRHGDDGAEQLIDVTTAAATPTTLSLTRVYPNTTGTDADEEYVELKNTGNASVELGGWSISDPNKTTTLGARTIRPNETARLHRAVTKLSLNNDGDTIELRSPNNELIDRVTYDKAPSGETLDRTERGWEWSSQKKAAQPQPNPKTETTTNTKKNIATRTITISDAMKKQDDAKTNITGVVTAAPGNLGKQIFYIQDETAGIQAYKHDATFPELHVGQEVTLNGVLSSAQGHRRLKLRGENSIMPSENTSNVSPAHKSMNELKTQTVGTLVTTSGVIASRTKDEILLEEKGEQVRVMLGSHINEMEELVSGNKLMVTGILVKTDPLPTIKPRSAEDLVIAKEATPIAGTTKKSGSSNNKEQLGTLLSAGSSAILVALFLRHYRKELYATLRKAVPAHKGAS